jgi:hypothetical protein
VHRASYLTIKIKVHTDENSNLYNYGNDNFDKHGRLRGNSDPSNWSNEKPMNGSKKVNGNGWTVKTRSVNQQERVCHQLF